MPKRFTATEKWIDPWFCSLTDNEKLFWLYLLDNCNHAGIWEPNWFIFGAYVKNFVFNPDHFKDRIVIVGKKWHIPKFIEFQYGTLNPDNRAHASVIEILQKEGAIKPSHETLIGPMDKDKVKDKDKVRDKEDVKIPEWIDSSVWYAFVTHRKAKRAKLTSRAAELIIKHLYEFRTQGHNPNEILNRSIMNGWTGVFAPNGYVKPISGDMSRGEPSRFADVKITRI